LPVADSGLTGFNRVIFFVFVFCLIIGVNGAKMPLKRSHKNG